MFNIEINGKSVEANDGQMVIDAADAAGIYIPRFCYHKKLSVAANCRMCLVEVEKMGKPVPACATPAVSGMKVFTQSQKALDAQKAVMEFLLINHPLDCPICDQGGECELQDLAVGYGDDVGRYTEGKRSVADEDIGPLVATEMTRCIHCTRCVRFGTEIAGFRELGMTGRGEKSRIGTYVKHFMQSEVSGNIIDLCPVGALTSKPYRFTARAWEMSQQRSIAPHDCLGSNIYVHTRGYEYSDYREVMRVVPRENESINETWLSDRDRFSYEGLHKDHRLTGPLIKKEGKWLQVDWSTALNFAVNNLRDVVNAKKSEQLAAIASPSSTTEELYLLQKIMRDLGSNNIDHRLQQMDFSQQENCALYPGMNTELASLESMDTILLVGSDIRREQPLAGLRVRKASLNGATIMRIGSIDSEMNFKLTENIHTTPFSLIETLKTILDSLTTSANNNPIAQQLKSAEKSIIILGAEAQSHPQATLVRALCLEIAKLSNAHVATMTVGANSAGAWIAGAVPHRKAAGENLTTEGLNAQTMFSQPRAAYILLNVEPEHDLIYSASAIAALKAADFVVCMSPYMSSVHAEVADVLLPIAPFTETDGTFVNVEGKWQSFNAVSPPFGEVRPGWKVLRVLGNLLELQGYDYICASEIRTELEKLLEHGTAPTERTSLDKNATATGKKGLEIIYEWPAVCIDGLARRAKALQATLPSMQQAISINQSMAQDLGVNAEQEITLKQSGLEITVPVQVDARVPNNCVLIPKGITLTSGFGDGFAEINVERGNRHA
ncbi:MAG: NADH-quinone oxidoreductase subunit NuoG [Gammaproteobacteria bacterium]|nr:NADH-quinone oxidoreductase subunit NuoG [Gammaproteobacteria bacterium]